jgi:hypothetical protein
VGRRMQVEQSAPSTRQAGELDGAHVNQAGAGLGDPAAA